MIPDVERELRDYYAARAPEFDDEQRYPAERASDVACLRKWVPGHFTSKRTIDVACGTGSWTAYISQTAASVVGVDINESMLEIARRRPGVNGVRFVLGDAYALSDELGIFEAGFVGFWLSHVPRSRVAEFLLSLHRRLAPGATVLIVDNSEALCRTIPISGCDAEGNSFQIRQLADGSCFRVLKNFPTEAELVAATAPFGANPSFRKLEHFWSFSYESIGQAVGA
jgi:demethylmenaquinone methyltransferase/2-methoxy-6-polyprenyl-1,4-benzoquinol methylase